VPPSVTLSTRNNSTITLKYFEAKVAGVRAATDGTPHPSFTQSSTDDPLTMFSSVTAEEVTAAVRELYQGNAARPDPFPTSTRKTVTGELCTFPH